MFDSIADFVPVMTLRELEAIVAACKDNPDLPVYMVRELLVDDLENL